MSLVRGVGPGPFPARAGQRAGLEVGASTSRLRTVSVASTSDVAGQEGGHQEAPQNAGCSDHTSSRRTDAFLRGTEKIDSSGPQLRKMPVTTQHLHLLYQRLDLQHRQGSALWASALLTSFFMLRASNVVAASTSSYEPSYIISRRDVAFYRDDSATSRVQLTPKTLPLIQRMEITIKKFKTEQHTRGFTNILQRISHPYLCVVKAVVHH